VRSPVKAEAVRAAVGASDRLTFAEADLTADAGWAEAVAGVDYVLHVAASLGTGDLMTPALYWADGRRGGAGCPYASSVSCHPTLPSMRSPHAMIGWSTMEGWPIS
jgi:hypothetical protein